VNAETTPGVGCHTIVVGSTSPAKLGAVAEGFTLLGLSPGDVLGVEVADAPAQPRSDEATLAGAEHRADVARTTRPTADYWVGIEGGLETIGTAVMLSAWIVVMSERGVGRSRSASYELPEAIAREVRRGDELGVVAARVSPDPHSGTGLVGTLTNDRITRQSLYVMPVALAVMRLLPAWNRLDSAGPVGNGS
jgi:inosine/xanthosine triphosphatase